MELLHLEVNNIGPFKGTHKLSLHSSAERFVHIVIGANGSGKTSLVRAICWGLGLYDPTSDVNVSRWVSKDCELGSVKLKLQVDGDLYEITRTALEPIHSSAEACTSIQINILNSLTEESCDDFIGFRSKFFSNIEPTHFHRLLVFNTEESLTEGKCLLFKTASFASWAKNQLACLEIPGVSRWIIDAAMEDIGGPLAHAAYGDKIIGAMLLHCLFREWMRADQSSICLNSLNTVSFPWLLDSPFSVLNSEHRIAAASLIARFYGTVIIFSSDRFSDSDVKIMGEVIGSVSAIRTRDDGAEFSELISHTG